MSTEDIEVPKSRLFSNVDPDKYRQVLTDLFELRKRYPTYRDDELLVHLVLQERHSFGRSAKGNFELRAAPLGQDRLR